MNARESTQAKYIKNDSDSVKIKLSSKITECLKKVTDLGFFSKKISIAGIIIPSIDA